MRRGMLRVVGVGVLISLWYAVGVFTGAYLRLATAESSTLSKTLIGKEQCPDVLAFPNAGEGSNSFHLLTFANIRAVISQATGS